MKAVVMAGIMAGLTCITFVTITQKKLIAEQPNTQQLSKYRAYPQYSFYLSQNTSDQNDQSQEEGDCTDDKSDDEGYHVPPPEPPIDDNAEGYEISS
ncbi:hypothetical protein [Fischerella sp. PCC 9605]|uniref:hypothetical protein n=1 Tax=Fischerella sp. PCC 9605 TaxID=1173024 RepID=UPI0012DD4B47|nr:hypothetical protein [Fischerella sp. PCC 9605]